MTPTAATPVQNVNSPIRNIGLWCLYVFLFLAFSRVFDQRLSFLHLPLILSLIGLACGILSARIHRAIATRVGLLFTAFTLWLIVGIPFAFWRAQAFWTLQEWFKSYMLFMLIVSLIGRSAECRIAMTTVAVGAAAAGAEVLFAHATIANRLTMAGGAWDNPNDLAQALLLALPFWGLGCVSGGVIRRVLSAMILLGFLWIILQTGSRGGMIALLGCTLLMFLRVSFQTKLKLAAACMIAMVWFTATIPRQLRNRYVSVLSGKPVLTTPEDVQEEETSLASARERRILLMQSLKATITHPIFGVGAGNFQAFAAANYHEEGRRALWRESHNSYTQVSSEIGLPGLGIFLAILFFCFRSMNAISKKCRKHRELHDLLKMAEALRFSLLSYAITSLFSSTAYKILFPCIAALCMVFIESANNELLRFEPAPSEPEPATQLALPQRALPVRVAW